MKEKYVYNKRANEGFKERGRVVFRTRVKQWGNNCVIHRKGFFTVFYTFGNELCSLIEGLFFQDTMSRLEEGSLFLI